MRLFVALDLPAQARNALPAPGEGWRAVRREHLHVTLAFLGRLPDDAPAAVRSALSAPLPAVGPLRLGRAILLPPRRPRVLAVELSDPSGACLALQATVSEALAAAGLYEPEKRRWLPHVTIGRATGPVARDAPLPAVEPVEFALQTVSLYRSHLNPRGARYEAIEGFPLG